MASINIRSAASNFSLYSNWTSVNKNLRPSSFNSFSIAVTNVKSLGRRVKLSIHGGGGGGGAASVVFRNLDADDFRHPLDRQAVMAYELGHLKCDHGVWLTFANILTLGACSLPGLGGLIAQRLEEQLLCWLRAAELTCDRAALLVAQDPKVVISVLMKLAGGWPSLADQLNVGAFWEQARSYDKASSSPVGCYIRNAQMRQLSHPLPVLWACEIDEWSRSQEYKSLLTRARAVNSVQNVAI